ncbi:MAG: NAD(P)-binding protein, partial [Candidatus Adiutrix sp.]|nr:NAD(P)-binding protein [Candidatus Adiutrix sp.]
MSQYRPVSERLTDYKPVELRLPPDVLEKELKCCQDCGIPFCHAVGCTLANVIPEINAAALAGRWESALANLQSTSPFPEITARICPALCEGSCVQGLNGLPVPCRLVEYEVIERGFAAGWVRPRPPLRCLPYSAAVIGSGPAGLAVAWRLNQAGLAVTVYERDARPGGFLRYGIPDFKLAKDILDRRITLLEQEGIKFECGVEAGLDISERLLQRRYDLVVLAVGARRQRDLDLPGRNLAGIHQATDYLSAQN